MKKGNAVVHNLELFGKTFMVVVELDHRWRLLDEQGSELIRGWSTGGEVEAVRFAFKHALDNACGNNKILWE